VSVHKSHDVSVSPLDSGHHILDVGGNCVDIGDLLLKTESLLDQELFAAQLFHCDTRVFEAAAKNASWAFNDDISGLNSHSNIGWYVNEFFGIDNLHSKRNTNESIGQRAKSAIF